MYRILGSLDNLGNLSLTLDASDFSILWPYEAFTSNIGYATRNWPPPPDDESFDNFERELYPKTFIHNGPTVRNGHVRNAFINCAVDKNLALAIFNTISYTGRRNESRLQNLSVRTIGGGSFTPYTDLRTCMAPVVYELSRSWEITRNSSMEGYDVSIKEMDKSFSEQRAFDMWTQRNLEEPALSVFRSLWPATDAQAWKQEWRSFPLASFDGKQNI
ncbi:hypothetical protein QM012_002143 [Aureobasidium pullulans]|uniref:Uncharacterized protein n=1 Tax=Aureobasidium pullulans TaxID=5580 RepID=A0ABR0TB28_AURPU